VIATFQDLNETQANNLFVGFNQGETNLEDTLASLGPVLGLVKLAQGEITTEMYLHQFGHRGPNELELSKPRPLEDPTWLENQLKAWQNKSLDIENMLANQYQSYQTAWQYLSQKYPYQAKFLHKQLIKVNTKAKMREATRSEFTRLVNLGRVFALRVAEMLDVNQTDIFF
jgi:pyruvate,water dikinase